MEVVKPNVGEKKPARVRADVTLQLSVHQSIKEEWEGGCVLREGGCVVG